MELKEWSYEEFPEYSDIPRGAQMIMTSGNETGTYYLNDVEYAVVDGIHLHLQVLLPLSRNHPVMERVPAVVYVQGSGWNKQDIYHNVGRIARLADRGYVTAVVEYRYAEQAGFPAQIQDAKNAIRFMRLHADEFHVDPDKIFAAGSSSGGHTALFASILPDDGAMDRNLYPGVSSKVCGILDYYGAVSFTAPDSFPSTLDFTEERAQNIPIIRNLPGDTFAEKMRKVTAVSYITPELELPPVFIIHGTKDRVVNTRQSVELYQKLKEQNRDVEFYLLKGADHGGPEFWSQPVIDRADAFIRRCLADQKKPRLKQQ